MAENELPALKANGYNPIEEGIYETKVRIDQTEYSAVMVVDATPRDRRIVGSISTILIDDKNRNVRQESIEIDDNNVTITIDGPVVRIGNYKIDGIYDPVASRVADIPLLTLYGLNETKNREDIEEGKKNMLSRIEQIVCDHLKSSRMTTKMIGKNS